MVITKPTKNCFDALKVDMVCHPVTTVTGNTVLNANDVSPLTLVVAACHFEVLLLLLPYDTLNLNLNSLDHCTTQN